MTERATIDAFRLTELENVQNDLDRLILRLRCLNIGDADQHEDFVLSQCVDGATGAMDAASTLLIRAQELAEVG